MLTAAVKPALVGGDVDDVARLYRPHVPQRHEQPDLELIGIHEPRDDVAARQFLAGAPHAVRHDTVKRRRDPRTRKLVVGLRKQGSRHLEIGCREVAVRLRLVDVEARHGRPRGAQPLELAVEARQVDAGTLDPRRLLGACERQLADVHSRDELTG